MEELMQAPEGFDEIHSDFKPISSANTIVVAWIAGLLLALTIGPLCYFGVGPAFGVFIGSLFVIWPIATMYSAKANLVLYRYYTYVYRTGKPIKADISVRREDFSEGITYYINVFRPETGVLEYAMLVTGGIKPIELADEYKGVDVYYLPGGEVPLVADLGGKRVWIEPCIFETKTIEPSRQ